MWPISDRFARALTSDHERTTKVEVLTDPDQVPVDVTEWFDDGQVDVGRNTVRRSGTFSFVDDGSGTIVPDTPDDLLAPYGNELRIWSGIRFPDDTEELVPVATLRIVKTTSVSGRVTVEAADRSVNVSRNHYEKTKVIRRGTLWDQVVAQVLLERYPGAEIDFAASTDLTCPQVVVELDTDPWAWLQQVAADTLEAQLYADPMGVFRLAPEEATPGDVVPVWTFDGRPLGQAPPVEDNWANLALYDQALEWDTAEMWNCVVVTGTSKDNAAVTYYGIAKDTVPDSPTRYGGKYGRSVKVETSELVTSNQQAGRAARTRLQALAGLPEALTFSAVPNPALDLSDAVLVRRPELGIDTIHLLDSLPLPLRASGGSQRVSTRLRRVVPEP